MQSSALRPLAFEERLHTLICEARPAPSSAPLARTSRCCVIKIANKEFKSQPDFEPGIGISVGTLLLLRRHAAAPQELKHLYTAITRAKNNIIIFDRSPEKRAPFFQYLRRRGLARVVRKCASVSVAE